MFSNSLFLQIDVFDKFLKSSKEKKKNGDKHIFSTESSSSCELSIGITEGKRS
jgi:hypothetical protein